MIVYFITRFSIFDYDFKGYKLTKNLGIEDKSYLFSKERLDYKFDSFEKITLPSIVSQQIIIIFGKYIQVNICQ